MAGRRTIGLVLLFLACSGFASEVVRFDAADAELAEVHDLLTLDEQVDQYLSKGRKAEMDAFFAAGESRFVEVDSEEEADLDALAPESKGTGKGAKKGAGESSAVERVVLTPDELAKKEMLNEEEAVSRMGVALSECPGVVDKLDWAAFRKLSELLEAAAKASGDQKTVKELKKEVYASEDGKAAHAKWKADANALKKENPRCKMMLSEKKLDVREEVAPTYDALWWKNRADENELLSAAEVPVPDGDSAEAKKQNELMLALEEAQAKHDEERRLKNMEKWDDVFDGVKKGSHEPMKVQPVNDLVPKLDVAESSADAEKEPEKFTLEDVQELKSEASSAPVTSDEVIPKDAELDLHDERADPNDGPAELPQGDQAVADAEAEAAAKTDPAVMAENVPEPSLMQQTSGSGKKAKATKKKKKNGRRAAAFIQLMETLESMSPKAPEECKEKCEAEFKTSAPKPGLYKKLKALVKESFFVKENAADGMDETALTLELLRDVKKANRIFGQKASDAILTYGPVKEAVREFAKRLGALIELADKVTPAASGKSYFEILFKPFTAQPSELPASSSPDTRKMAYVGDIGPQGTKEKFYAIVDEDNVRQTLSLVYKMYYRDGNGNGVFSLLFMLLDKLLTAEDIKTVWNDNKEMWKAVGVSWGNVKHDRDEGAKSPCYPSGGRGRGGVGFATSGWSMLKYQCGVNYVDRVRRKVVPVQWSHKVVPPLTTHEVEFLYGKHLESLASDEERTAFRRSLFEHGERVPWTCGGDNIQFVKDKMPEVGMSYKEWATLAGLEPTGGPSGTSAMFGMSWRYLHMSATTELRMRAAILAWMVNGGDHSFLEVMAGLDAYGMPFQSYHAEANDWERAWDRVFVRNPRASDAIKAVDAGSDDFFEHLFAETDAECTPSFYAKQSHVNRRAAQYWFASSTKAFPEKDAPALEACGGVLSGIDMPKQFVAPRAGKSKDRYQYLVVEAYQRGSGGKDSFVVEVGLTLHEGKVYFAMRKVTRASYTWETHNALKTYAAARLFPRLTNDEFKTKYNIELDLAGSPLTTRTRTNGDACLKVSPLAKAKSGKTQVISVCSKHKENLFALKEAIEHARVNENGMSCEDHLFDMMQAYPQAFLSARSVPATNPVRWANAQKFICAYKPTEAERQYVELVQEKMFCGKTATSDEDKAYVECVKHGLLHHREVCNFRSSGKAQACTPDYSYWQELAYRLAVCAYSHEELYRDVARNKAEHVKKIVPMLNAALQDPRSEPYMPKYQGLVFHGKAGTRLASYEPGTELNFGLTSFTRSVMVANRFNYDRKDKPDRDKNGGQTVVFLVNAPYARDIGDVGIYYDDEQETTLLPSVLRVLSRRTFNCDQPPDGEKLPYGPYAEVFAEVVRLRV